MLTSISPLGERARGHRCWVTTTSYVVGSTCGGLLLGLLRAGNATVRVVVFERGTITYDTVSGDVTVVTT